MEKFFKILYYYLLISFVLFVMYLSVVLALSPKKDVLKRGFIPCTEQMVLNVGACERGDMFCPLKWLWQDTKCNTSVVLDGLGAWIKGNQPTPWSSYLFEPVEEKISEDEEPYEGNVSLEMNELNLHHDFIKEKLKELEEAKNREMNFDDSVIISSPDEEFQMIPFIDYDDEIEKIENSEGVEAIVDEFSIGEIEAKKDANKEQNIKDDKENINE